LSNGYVLVGVAIMFVKFALADVRVASSAAWHWRVIFALFLYVGGTLLSGQVAAQTASISAITGQSCAGTRFGSNLNCTANDFSSALSFDQPSGNAIANCVAGSTISINVIAAITSNSPQRYDGAYFLGENGISPELNSTSSSCSLGVFPATPSPFQNQDSDVCGDYVSGGVSTLEITNAVVKCSPVPGTNQLALPYVLVFNNNTGGSSCTTANITANTKSKCISSTTATVTGVTVNGFVSITKQTVPDTQPGTFVFSGSASPAATVTPASGNLVDNGSQMFEVPLNAGGTRTLTISETALAGWDPTAAITCTTPSGGSAATYVTVNNATRTITADLTETNFGALCTVTNTKRPTVKLQKLTEGDFGGPFTFSATNLDTAFGDSDWHKCCDHRNCEQ
jgi:trimeric autotransporter adhesin